MLVHSRPGRLGTELTSARQSEHLRHHCCNLAGKLGSRTIQVICDQSSLGRTGRVAGAVRQSVAHLVDRQAWWLGYLVDRQTRQLGFFVDRQTRKLGFFADRQTRKLVFFVDW